LTSGIFARIETFSLDGILREGISLEPREIRQAKFVQAKFRREIHPSKAPYHNHNTPNALCQLALVFQIIKRS
jgi:hypothetical protein